MTTEGRLNVFGGASQTISFYEGQAHLYSFDYDLINTIFPNENGIVFGSQLQDIEITSDKNLTSHLPLTLVIILMFFVLEIMTL